MKKERFYDCDLAFLSFFLGSLLGIAEVAMAELLGVTEFLIPIWIGTLIGYLAWTLFRDNLE